MKVKIEVKSWNYYPPRHTLGGGGAYSTYLAPKENNSRMQKLLMGPLNTKHSYCLKKNLFGLHEIAWCPWQTIGHCSWVICKMTQDRHIFSVIFSLFH